MFYTPNYCCNCGEKIERADRSWSDSNRFCDVCKHDFVLPRMLPVLFASLMTLFGLFGIGSLLKTGPPPASLASRPIAVNRSGVAPTISASPQNPVNSTVTKLAPRAAVRSETPDSAAEQPITYCGAETKKGTACTRRVKGGGRCWQHAGQNALPGTEKTPPFR